MAAFASTRRVAVLAVSIVGGVLMMMAAGGASAAGVPASDFTCGVTVFDTPCNQTAHFSDLTQVGTPLASSSSCPSFISSDYALIVGSGNGVEHSIINNALDGWFTTTFTGDATLTAYIGDPTADGVPDPTVPQYTGRLTEWFGGSFNRSNFVIHSTVHFDGTAADGTTLRADDTFHLNTATGSVGPPHFFEFAHCG